MHPFKKIIHFFALSSILWSQFDTPVSLSVFEKEPMRAGEVASVIVKAEMEPEWRIYALRNQGIGPIASKVTLIGDIMK